MKKESKKRIKSKIEKQAWKSKQESLWNKKNAEKIKEMRMRKPKEYLKKYSIEENNSIKLKRRIICKDCKSNDNGFCNKYYDIPCDICSINCNRNNLFIFLWNNCINKKL